MFNINITPLIILYFFNILFLFAFVFFFKNHNSISYNLIKKITILIFFIIAGVPPFSIFFIKILIIIFIDLKTNYIFFMYLLFNTFILYFYYSFFKKHFFKKNTIFLQKKTIININIKNIFIFYFLYLYFNFFFLFYLDFYFSLF